MGYIVIFNRLEGIPNNAVLIEQRMVRVMLIFLIIVQRNQLNFHFLAIIFILNCFYAMSHAFSRTSCYVIMRVPNVT